MLARTLLVLLLCVASGGCCAVVRALCPETVPPPPDPEGAVGPFGDRRLAKREVVEVLNRRAAAFDILGVKGVRVLADVETTRGEELVGDLYLRKPLGTYFDARKPVVDRRIGFGSNDEVFWFYETFQQDKMLLGRWRYKGLPCAGRLPLDPIQIFSLLGVFPIVEDPVAGPFASLTYSPATGLYRLSVQRWLDPRRPERGVYLEREVFLNRGRLEPVRAVYYTRDGALLLEAEIAAYTEIEGRLLPRDVFVRRPVYDQAGTTVEREDRIRIQLGDPTAPPAPGVITFAPPEKFRDRPDEWYRLLFDPESDRFPENKEFIDKACENEQPTPPTPLNRRPADPPQP
jgi:hypothetical protein